MKKQAIVKQGDRVWDSIRDQDDQALFRVSEHMMKDHDSNVVTVGKLINWRLIFGKGVAAAKVILEREGFTLEVKDIPTQPKD